MNKKRLKKAVAAALIILATFSPIWTMKLNAPLYGKKWLHVTLYSYKVEGDVKEVNIVNHYVGLREINPEEMIELKIAPIIFGILDILALVGVAVSSERFEKFFWIVLVLTAIGIPAYLQYWLYNYGHDLNPKAAVEIEPFTPPVITITPNKVGNFRTISYLDIGYWMIVAAMLLYLPDSVMKKLKRSRVVEHA